MPQKIFKRVGLRRDNDLSDVSNAKEALNNLLDTLVDETTSTFITEDLDALQGIYANGLSADQFREVIGSSVTNTSPTGINLAVYPRITYQNRIDIFNLFSGNPRFNGGNGLTATYFESDDVYDTLVGIFSGTPLKTDNFWEAGNFDYAGKITENAVNVNGGVLWEGYFVPYRTGVHQFEVSSTACFTFDFQTQGYTSGVGTYTEIARIGISSVLSGVATANQNSLFLNSSGNAKYVAIGQSVSASGIVAGTTVDSVNATTGVISLLPPEGTEFAVSSGFSGNITFFKNVGQYTRTFHNTYVLNKYQPYRIRIRYYIPRNYDAFGEVRSINIDVLYPQENDQSHLRINRLFSLDYNFSSAVNGTFTNYYDNSIGSGGGIVGGTSSSNDYVKVKSTKTVNIVYQPKTSVSAITRASVQGTSTSGANVILVSDTTNFEFGNYVFGSNIPDNTRIIDYIINEAVVLDKNCTASGTTNLTVIDHRGFVQRSVGSGSGGSFTLTSGNTSILRSGMIMIGSGIQAYTGITTSASLTNLTISPSQTIGAGTTVYFYQAKGLIDEALRGYCLPTETQCLIASSSVPAGSTSIPVTDSTKVFNGWQVFGAQFQPNTLINGAPPNATTVNISRPTLSTINAGGNFTVTNQGSTKTLCCPPTDTSPPFDANNEGLTTTAAAPILRILSGDLAFGDFSAILAPSSITSYTSTDTSKNRITIKTPSGNYKILCV